MQHITTSRDPFTDQVTQLGFLTSHDYVDELLNKIWGASTSSAKNRAPRIVAHMRGATEYLDQAMSGPPEVAFLPAYSAILNLLKVYILLSARHSELQANRYHGASYDVYAKDSRSILTEEIILRSKGAMPLVYEIITGSVLKDKSRVRLGDIYPYLADISAEWILASGKAPKLAFVDFSFEAPEEGRRRILARVELQQGSQNARLKDLQVLREFTKDPRRPAQFVARTSEPVSVPDSVAIWRRVRPFLLYHPNPTVGASIVPVSSKKLQMFEELPIALAFYHLSSVVRYKPEFLARIRDSRFWPMMVSMQSHCLGKFISLFWSYVQKKTMVLTHA